MLSSPLSGGPSLNYSRMCFLVNCLKRLKSSQQWLSRQKADPYVEKAKIYNYRLVTLMSFIRRCTDHYLLSEQHDVRLEAVKTVAKLLVKAVERCAQTNFTTLNLLVDEPLGKICLSADQILTIKCRSAFKLLEMNEKSKILTPGLSVIDLGASPGSWTQVAVQMTNADGADKNKPKGTVLAIDKLQIFPIEGATIMSNMDFSTVEAHDKVIKTLGGQKVDIVLSDMAPSATGVRELDKDRIVGLCYMAIRFAALVTKVDGSLLFKVWDGKEVPILEMDLDRFYKHIKILKPKASRSESSEKFILARGFKGVERPLRNGRWGEVE